MQRNFIGAYFIVIVLLSVFSCSCTKIDTTSLGADLIPAVDNVNTFDTVININGTQGFFTDEDSLTRNESHLVGSITNDPVFGKTYADLFLELKPSFFPYYFGSSTDTINPIAYPATGFDSAYLCLSVKGFYGDTLKPQHLKVFVLNENTSNFKDSSYKLDFVPNINYTTQIGDITIDPRELSTVRYFNINTKHKDSATNQIRIKLDSTFLSSLTANLDTSSVGSPNNIFRSDAIFKSKFKGFAIECDKTSGNGNGLFYISIADAATRMEVYYHSIKKDTSYSAFTINTSTSLTITNSAHANHIQRDYSTAEMRNSPQPDALYILSTPGTFASLKIPGLENLSNRIIHRAELIVEQIPGADIALDKALAAPPFLYLDLKDTGTSGKYITVFKDLNPSATYDPYSSTLYYPSGGIEFSYFGGFRRDNYNVANNRKYYNFNLSRYVQDIVTNHIPNYELRLYAPYNLNYTGYSFAFPNSTLFLCNGRVKIGNGNNANPDYRLRMRIVYSKI